jgi:hypothetical protein
MGNIIDCRLFKLTKWQGVDDHNSTMELRGKEGQWGMEP